MSQHIVGSWRDIDAGPVALVANQNSSKMSLGARKRAGSIIDYKNHHLAGPFLPQTPIGSTLPSPERSESPVFQQPRFSMSLFVNWLIDPTSTLKPLLLPIILYLNWEFVSGYVDSDLSNPFAKVFLLSGYIQGSKSDDPRYRKTWWDILFLVYYVVFFAFVRQSIISYIARPLARYFGIRRPAKLDRFGEQTYAFLYFMVFGTWGYRIMSTLPTYWYNTTEFWKGYPHWDMKAELKWYYLMQFSHWIQELLVVLLGLEKARKDYLELVAHHIVTLWLIGWSYLLNFTYIGNAVYMSMDIPDTFLAFSKLLNYIQWNTAKIYSFGLFFVIWSYFRHYLNFWILWSIWFEMLRIPNSAKQWSWSDGVYLPDWMKYQVFAPMLLLQCLNLFWYWLITKVLVRAVTTAQAEDDRSDDEDQDQDDFSKKED